MECKKCKRVIQSLNLSIYHNCTSDIPSDIWDTEEDDNYYCYNPYKNINISKFYKQITFERNIQKTDFPSELEQKGLLILELLFKNFFDLTNLSSYEKFILFNSRFSDEGGQNLEKLLKKVKSIDEELDKIILNEIKAFLLDIYYLIISLSKINDKKKKFLDIFTRYKEEDPNYYKKNIINFFKEKIEKEEKIKNYMSSNHNINEGLYLPRYVQETFIIEKKYLILLSHSTILLYYIEKKQILDSYNGIKKLKKINDYNYIGINEEIRILFNLKVKIKSLDNYGSFEINPFFKFEENINDFNFNILTNDKLVWIDKYNYINLTILKPNNESYLYKKITSYQDTKILIVDKNNNQIASAFIDIDYEIYILNFYDFELNFKKCFELYGENAMIYLLNKNLYILFGNANIYLIDAKYLEIVSEYNINFINKHPPVFVFSNSNEFFIDDCLIYHYKLIKNEIILHKTSSKRGKKNKLIELKEINDNGDYSILYKDNSTSYLKYYINNNIREKYEYPDIMKDENDISDYDYNNDYNDTCNENNSYLETYDYNNDYNDSCNENNSYLETYDQYKSNSSLEDEENFEDLKYKKIPINYIMFDKIKDSKESQLYEWNPLTNLGKIARYGTRILLPKIFYHSIPIKEDKIVDFSLKQDSDILKEECISIKKIGNKFRAIVIIGNLKGIVGLGIKASKDIKSAIVEAGKEARLNIISVRRGFFKKPELEVYTIANKVEGKSGSVKVQLIPAPKGTGLPVQKEAKKLFQFAGIEDIIMKSFGNKNNVGNLLQAICNAFNQTYKKNDLSIIFKDDYKLLMEHPLQNLFDEYKDIIKNNK